MSVPYNLFERLLLWRLEPILDRQLSDKKAGFRHSQCITDQVFKLTYNVEHRFDENNKSGTLLINLTAPYDSVLYGTKAKHPTTAFDLLLLLQPKF